MTYCSIEMLIFSKKNNFRYRRTYDSEFSAPLVNHHIWPCLMQEGRVVIKGEACTLRGASLVRIL